VKVTNMSGMNNTTNWMEYSAAAMTSRGSRIPPGGKSSISLGWDQTPKDKTAKASTTETPQVVNEKLSGGDVDEAIVKEGMKSPVKCVSSNSFANGDSQNVGNVLTDRPTSRVLQPPGGRSSITFG
jgi:SPIRAL1-like protein